MNIWRTDDSTLYHADHYTVRHLFESSHIVVVWFGFMAGQVLRDHKTSSHALIQCLSGTIIVQAMGESTTLEAGMCAVLEPQSVHALYARERALVQLLITPHPNHHTLAEELQLT
ncbi:MAG: cupin domain-containing protein [Sulfobacillus sp.]